MFEDFKKIKKPFATDKEIEEYFDIPCSTQKTWRNGGVPIPYFRVKDTIKYPRQMVAEWFEKQIKNKNGLKLVSDETDSNQEKLKKS